MRDQKIELRNLHSSHTLGSTTEQTFVVYYESIKRKLKTKYIWGVGVMKDYNLTLTNLRASHTLSLHAKPAFFFHGITVSKPQRRP
jgi:hypothetical protein